MALFGVVIATIDYVHGQYLIAAIDLSVTIVSFLILHFRRSPLHPKLPLGFSIGLLLYMYFVGTFQIMPHQLENCVWAITFPFLFFYLTGLRTGLWLSLLCASAMPFSYAIFPLFSDVPRITPYSLLEVIGAFLMATMIGYKYEQIRTEQETLLRRFAECDPLTGLLNRRGFSALSPAVIQHALRSQESFAVALLDIDDFKQVNDTQGHDVGDQVLREIASLLKQNTRSTDLIARWGGEEFILLLAHSNREGALAVAEKICSAISTHHFTSGRHTASFGLAFHEQSEPLEATINRADHAMYQAKRSGKNKIEVLLLQPA